MEYISEHFELNIKATKKFKPFRFNESWINCRRTSTTFTVKCQGDRLYAFGLRCLYRGASDIIVIEEGMQEGKYDDEL